MVYTGGSLNPARSIGPDIVLGHFDGYHWIYWIGPLLGAIIAVLFYRFIKFLEYETANPGADGDGNEVRYDESYAAEEVEDPRRGSRLYILHYNEASHSTNGALGRTTTDGTNESEFSPPFNQASRPAPELHKSILPRYNVNGHISTESGGIALSNLPNKPPASFHHGGDGQYSIDHPNERPRAQHGLSSYSSRSRSQSHPEPQYEETSERSYRSGPSAESGGSVYSSRSNS